MKRYRWAREVDFLITGIGGMVGIGNYWRFPSICYNNGGGKRERFLSCDFILRCGTESSESKIYFF